jgi:DNA-binding transcriptional ArsR family regulator
VPSAPPFPRVRIVSGPAFEVIAELAAFRGGPARAALESGKPWIRDVRRLAGGPLIAKVDRWAFPLYTELAPIALEARGPYTVERLVKHLRASAAEIIRRRLLGAESVPNRAMVSDGAFERALEGDAVARAELRENLGLDPAARRSLDLLLSTPAETVKSEIVEIVEQWAARVFPAFAESAMALIGRDVGAKQALLREGSARDAVRASTNGVDVDLADWATDIVIVPTVALRPFIAPVESASTAVLLCSVADEAFDTDPAHPPRRLVKVVSALGDELRLRIVRELADEDLTASELADRLQVDRTSLHHHLGILRSAGLVGVRAQGVQSWRYSARPEGLATASELLGKYLGPARARSR